ncbi:MAG: hypothetical protein U0T33_02720 [Bacteroidales bacterium]
MKKFSRFIILSLLSFLPCASILKAQSVEFNGQAAIWSTVSNSGSTYIQTGVRFVPQLKFDVPVNKKYKLDGELSADGMAQYTHESSAGATSDGLLRLYRAWIRFTADRFELRAGLQKINFGSANILRPLMWFDRVDPRDPLKLTPGVISIAGKYYFRSNANIWLWTLIGNDKTKGWESVPSNPSRPEFGSRIQLPFPKGELAFTFHNREAEFTDVTVLPQDRYFNENRYGFDTKIDLGPGIWLEGTVTQRSSPLMPDFEKAFTIGVDYTIGLGQGLNLMAENMYISTSEKLASSDNNINLSGLSLSLPLSIITRINAIVFYDWKGKGLYTFGNLSFTYNNFVINVIAFDNPNNFSIMNFTTGKNIFAGYGGQVMVVYNF